MNIQTAREAALSPVEDTHHIDQLRLIILELCDMLEQTEKAPPPNP